MNPHSDLVAGPKSLGKILASERHSLELFLCTLTPDNKLTVVGVRS